MRIKKDVLIKTYVLANTMHLTNEEFGALMRNVLIEEDTNDSRYENVAELLLDIFKSKESEWKQDLEKLLTLNPTLVSAYSLVYGQAKNSRLSFEKLQDRYNEKDNAAKKLKDKPKAKTIDKTYTFNFNSVGEGQEIARAPKENENNLPDSEHIQELIGLYDLDPFAISDIFKAGNEDEWKQNYRNYIPDEYTEYKEEYPI